MGVGRRGVFSESVSKQGSGFGTKLCPAESDESQGKALLRELRRGPQTGTSRVNEYIQMWKKKKKHS